MHTKFKVLARAWVLTMGLTMVGVAGLSASALAQTPAPAAATAPATAEVKADAAALRERGHTLSDGERPWGNMNLVIWDLKTNALSGGSDPRGAVGKADVR